MKKYTICFFVAIALVVGSCHSDHKHATEDAHEHTAGDGHDHDAHDHDHEGHNHADGDDHDGEIHFSEQQAEAAGLEVQVIEPVAFSRVIKTGGEIQAAQGDEVTLVATSDGVVSFVNRSIADGMAVRAGEAVVSVSARTLQDGDRNAVARINYETERKAFERAEELVRDEIISAKEFEQIRRRYETARTAYDALSAHTTAEGVTVTAPVGGYIRNRMVGEGEYVSVGQPVATISQNSRLQLKADVPEKYYGLLRTVHTAHFRTASGDTLYKIREMNGRFLSFGKATEHTAGYISITFGFDNTDDVLPGAFAEVYLLTTAVADAIAIPLSAVTEEQGLYFVYLRVHDDAYRKQEVAIGADDGERVHIVAGLKSGDEVVTRGVYQVRLAANTGAIPEGHSHSH